MKNVAFLDYTFLIDTNNAFSHLFEFEKELAEFFDKKGLEAHILKAVEGSQSKRLMFICKKMDVGTPPPAPVGRPITPKGLIKKLGERKLRAPAVKFMKGKK